MGLFNFFSKKKLTLEKADAINEKFITKNPVPKDDENARMRDAAKLMSSRKFEEAVAAYTALATDFPAKKGLYESQVGAAYYFLGDHSMAIDWYLSAMKNGADAGMMDDNIWEATEAKYSITGDRGLLEHYKTLFPKGKYLKKIEKLVG